MCNKSKKDNKRIKNGTQNFLCLSSIPNTKEKNISNVSKDWDGLYKNSNNINSLLRTIVILSKEKLDPNFYYPK